MPFFLKKEPSAAFCLKKKKKKRKVFQKPQIPMSRVTQARGDVNQMPSRLGLHQSLALKPTFGNQTAVLPRTRPADYLTNKSGMGREFMF